MLLFNCSRAKSQVQANDLEEERYIFMGSKNTDKIDFNNKKNYNK